jgi:thiol-disulfide isomerase/thioredoxin
LVNELVGDRALEIHFDKLLPEQPVASARFEALAGKVVVLEMWATWCGPCVKAIPHLNELAGKFKDRPVVFLSVTDEEQKVVEAFLNKRRISGWVGIAHTQNPMSSWQREKSGSARERSSRH